MKTRTALRRRILGGDENRRTSATPHRGSRLDCAPSLYVSVDVQLDGRSTVRCTDVKVLIPGQQISCKVPAGAGQKCPLRVTVNGLRGSLHFLLQGLKSQRQVRYLLRWRADRDGTNLEPIRSHPRAVVLASRSKLACVRAGRIACGTLYLALPRRAGCRLDSYAKCNGGWSVHTHNLHTCSTSDS